MCFSLFDAAAANGYSLPDFKNGLLGVQKYNAY